MNTIVSRPRLDGIDMALVVIFLIGIYTHYTIQITATVPFPAALAGIAGMVMLWRRRNDISAAAFIGFAVVVLLYTLSILAAPDLSFLGRRFNGLIQITYSLTIAFALFVTVKRADRDQMARMFLIFSLTLLIGCVLEEHTALRAVSDAVRAKIYSAGVYDADVRDEMLYGHIRAKFFASEPSAVSLCFTIFTFAWFVTSRWRWKLAAYFVMVGGGFLVLSGPTLLLMILLLLPYQIFLAGAHDGAPRPVFLNLMKAGIVCALLGMIFVILANTVFANRLHEISSGSDPSFFYRVNGPILAAREVIGRYPISGAGLTGEPFVEDDVVNAYIGSPAFSRSWAIASAASELVINYFWLHWIYLGLVWGSIMIFAISAWLRLAGVRHVIFCWIVWAILGQASGAYVGPITWTVLFLPAACALLATRAEQEESAPAPAPVRAARYPEIRWRAAGAGRSVLP